MLLLLRLLLLLLLCRYCSITESALYCTKTIHGIAFSLTICASEKTIIKFGGAVS